MLPLGLSCHASMGCILWDFLCVLPETRVWTEVAFGLHLHLSPSSFHRDGCFAVLVYSMSRKRSKHLEQMLTEPLPTPEWPSRPHR